MCAEASQTPCKKCAAKAKAAKQRTIGFLVVLGVLILGAAYFFRGQLKKMIQNVRT